MGQTHARVVELVTRGGFHERFDHAGVIETLDLS